MPAPRSLFGREQLRTSAGDAREMLAAAAPKGRSPARWCRSLEPSNVDAKGTTHWQRTECYFSAFISKS